MTAVVRVQGREKLARKLEPNRLAGAPMRRFMQRTAEAVRAAARERARVASGAYRDGFRAEVDPAPLPAWWKVENVAPHAWFAHEGRRPGGRMPPRDPIARWIALRGIPASAEFPIRRKIAREGFAGDKALERGAEAARPRILSLADECCREIEREAAG